MSKRLLKLWISLIVFRYDTWSDKLRKARGLKPETRATFLYYHGISSNERGSFERQMELVARATTPIGSVEECPRAGARFAHVTFDDGFVSVLEQAVPVLKQLRIPATIFVPTGYLGQSPGWVTKDYLIARKETVMNREQLRMISLDPLLSIGSHTVSHPKISKLSEAAAWKEMAESKKTLEDFIGKPVPTFSFPHGAFSKRDLELAKAVGYKRVFSTQPGLALRRLGEFVIPRVAVDPLEWPIEFKLKLLGAYRWLEKSNVDSDED